VSIEILTEDTVAHKIALPFHKMAQNFGMMANYGEPKDKMKSSTTGTVQQLEAHPAEPKAKKLRVQPSEQDKPTGEEEKTSAA
jgi:hypothetical protein